jgi:transaldolase
MMKTGLTSVLVLTMSIDHPSSAAVIDAVGRVRVTAPPAVLTKRVPQSFFWIE